MENGYAKFCPTAMACAILEPRWSMLILCEMYSGSMRFNEIHGGVPGMSPSLLSRRLKEMQDNGLIEHTQDGLYATTPMADELEPLIQGLGEWAHRNVDPEVGLAHLDDKVLMWNIRRKIDARALPRRRSVIQFILKEAGVEDRHYWLLVRPNAETDLCTVDPRHDVDLNVTADLRALTRAWIGHSTFAEEIAAERIHLIGDSAMARSLSKWMIRSSFADDAPRQRRDGSD